MGSMIDIQEMGRVT